MKDLSLHLLDIARNSVAAGATCIKVSLVYEAEKLILIIADNGRGMEQEVLQRVTDPFVTTRTTRKVGMGLPLLKLSAEMTGGKFQITSAKGEGTTVEAQFLVHSIDRIPVGNVDDTMKALIQAEPDLNYELVFKNGTLVYELKTTDVKALLKAVPIWNKEVIEWVGNSIREGLNEVFGGVLNEISG